MTNFRKFNLPLASRILSIGPISYYPPLSNLLCHRLVLVLFCLHGKSSVDSNDKDENLIYLIDQQDGPTKYFCSHFCCNKHQKKDGQSDSKKSKIEDLLMFSLKDLCRFFLLLLNISVILSCNNCRQ